MISSTASFSSILSWVNFPALKSLRNAGLSHGFVILGSREFLTKLKKADMSGNSGIKTSQNHRLKTSQPLR
jgi:hypothetical protein